MYCLLPKYTNSFKKIADFKINLMDIYEAIYEAELFQNSLLRVVPAGGVVSLILRLSQFT